MVVHGHPSVFQVIFERIFKNVCDLIVSFFFLATTGHQVTVDGHKGLVIKLKAYADCTFVSGSSERPCLYATYLKGLGLYSVGKFTLDENCKVAANHGSVDENEFFIKYSRL